MNVSRYTKSFAYGTELINRTFFETLQRETEMAECFIMIGKGKVLPITVHEGPEGE